MTLETNAKSETDKIKPVKTLLKKIDLVSYPARAEGLGKYGIPPPVGG